MRIIRVYALLGISTLVGSLFLLPQVLLGTSPTRTPSATANATPSATAGPMIVFSASGRPSEMYSENYGTYQLYFSTDIDTPLTDDSGNYLNPRWSPDGEQIAYSYNGEHIEVMRQDGTERRILTSGRGEHSPAWSPDGSTIAYASSSDDAIYSMSADGKDVRLIQAGVDARSLQFSPDGTRLMFTSKHEGYDRIYIVPAMGGAMQLLFDDAGSYWDATWSPDGRTIAYISHDGIFLTEDEGRTSRKLEITGYMSFTLDDGFSAFYLDWSPDGSKLAFSLFSRRLQMAVSTPVPLDRVGAQLVMVDVTTGELDLLTYGFTNVHPDWMPKQ
jgi:Tol biopolymer transport system component